MQHQRAVARRAWSAGLALAVLGFALLPAAVRADTYVNARFGYSVSYPAHKLVAQRVSANGDGRTFRAKSGRATMSVFGGNWLKNLYPTPQALARSYEADCGAGKVTYQVAKPQLVAFSCITPAGGVIYQKTLIGGGALRSVRFDYPLAEQKAWDPVVSQVAASLQATR
jgi:hypothetical protein